MRRNIFKNIPVTTISHKYINTSIISDIPIRGTFANQYQLIKSISETAMKIFLSFSRQLNSCE